MAVVDHVPRLAEQMSVARQSLARTPRGNAAGLWIDGSQEAVKTLRLTVVVKITTSSEKGALRPC